MGSKDIVQARGLGVEGKRMGRVEAGGLGRQAGRRWTVLQAWLACAHFACIQSCELEPQVSPQLVASCTSP